VLAFASTAQWTG